MKLLEPNKNDKFISTLLKRHTDRNFSGKLKCNDQLLSDILWCAFDCVRENKRVIPKHL